MVSPGVVEHTYSPSTHDVEEAGTSRVQGYPCCYTSCLRPASGVWDPVWKVEARAGEMAQQRKALADKAGDPNSSPRTHTGDAGCPLVSTSAPWHELPSKINLNSNNKCTQTPITTEGILLHIASNPLLLSDLVDYASFEIKARTLAQF